MILTLPQIKAIIKENPQKDLLGKSVEYSKKLRRHIYGEGLENHVKGMKFEDYEKDKTRELRAKYTRSNKDLFSRLGRPIDKVFSARGGSIYYNLTDTAEKQARQLMQDVTKGYSVRKWIEMFWKPHMLDDPNGIIFMEIMPEQEAILAKQEGRSFVFPTYKSTSTIYDYLPKGNKLEYVVFTVDKKAKKMAGVDETLKVYRVVDDAFDYWVKEFGEDVQIMSNHSFPNFFGEVPAILNSDINDPETENRTLSFYDDVVELAEDFLIDGSIKRTHKLLHGFPKYSEFADDCPKCNGTKLIGASSCDMCNGTGKKIMLKVSDAKLLAWPGNGESVILPKDTGGYIEPSKTYFEIAGSELQGLEDAMNVTLWGMQSKLKAQGPSIQPGGEPQTATEIMSDMKPQTDRLFPISEMAELRHKYIMDTVIRMNINYAYQGSSVNYGRRYMLESPDAIWEKYSDARSKSAPQNVLDDLLNEYYDAKYQSDPVGLATAKKLMYVEPFVHYSASVLKGLNPDPEDYKAKLYYSEWLALQPETVILMSTIEKLKESLAQYVANKTLPEEKSKLIAA